ncbi:DUF4177 domain-containing protein [Anatilimnocola floriformis]|uniref:DUF4177 domain-containing protein n=1 Tax=Anatilimnocola floriformis TaxID=2948575 RepID=UPI0020C20BA2|nr:DUF4177 domain-containing protein [Anatilimnocola floriformis]
MTKNFQTLAILAVALTAIAGAWQYAGAQGEKIAAGVKFEYKILSGTSAGAGELNVLGKDGWELVAVEPSKGMTPTQLYFKRSR